MWLHLCPPNENILCSKSASTHTASPRAKELPHLYTWIWALSQQVAPASVRTKAHLQSYSHCHWFKVCKFNGQWDTCCCHTPITSFTWLVKETCRITDSVNGFCLILQSSQSFCLFVFIFRIFFFIIKQPIYIGCNTGRRSGDPDPVLDNTTKSLFQFCLPPSTHSESRITSLESKMCRPLSGESTQHVSTVDFRCGRHLHSANWRHTGKIILEDNRIVVSSHDHLSAGKRWRPLSALTQVCTHF